ncbi:MAG: hypothetical protein OER04_13190 [Cyclobacteriaceae bacterium]|nr:hypothetical protein [Cyclobacteriaceae bacterium]
MKGRFQVVLFMIFVWGIHSVAAQTIKLKFKRQDSLYVGNMSPKWFDKVQVQLKQDHTLVGSQGLMAGPRFGMLHFTIEANQLQSLDSLMIKLNNGWYPLTNVKFDRNKLQASFDWQYRNPAAEEDLQVLKQVVDLLDSESYWNPRDDRLCEDDARNHNWSLYCAIRQAYLDLTGDFNHRAAALEMVRKEISLTDPKGNTNIKSCSSIMNDPTNRCLNYWIDVYSNCKKNSINVYLSAT